MYILFFGQIYGFFVFFFLNVGHAATQAFFLYSQKTFQYPKRSFICNLCDFEQQNRDGSRFIAEIATKIVNSIIIISISQQKALKILKLSTINLLTQNIGNTCAASTHCCMLAEFLWYSNEMGRKKTRSIKLYFTRKHRQINGENDGIMQTATIQKDGA